MHTLKRGACVLIAHFATASIALGQVGEVIGNQLGQAAQSLGGYVDAREQLRLDIERLKYKIDQCGSCNDKLQLEADLANLSAQEAAVSPVWKPKHWRQCTLRPGSEATMISNRP